MRELQLNQIRVPTQFVGQRAKNGSEAVPGLLIDAVAQTPQCAQYAIRAHRPTARTQRRKNILAVASVLLDAAQNRHSLRAQWHNMLLAHLHF